MNGETWPKESQRLGNMVPGTGPDAEHRCGCLDLRVLRLEPESPETATPVVRAVETAEQILALSLDTAHDLVLPIEGCDSLRIQIGLDIAKMAMTAYAAHHQGDVVRECTPEIAGAVEGAGASIGAGLSEAGQAACKGGQCRHGT